MEGYLIEYLRQNPGTVLHVTIMLAGNISGLLYLQSKVLKQRRSRTLLFFYVIIKSLAVNLFMGVLLADYMQKERQIMTVYLILSALCGIFNILVMCYTYEGSLAKVGTVSIALEGVAAGTGSALFTLLNFLEGREAVTDIIQDFHPCDLLFPLLLWSLLFLLVRVCRKPIQKIRDCRFRHQKLWAAFVWVCVAAGILQMWGKSRTNLIMSWILMAVIACAAVLAVLGMVFLIWREYRIQVYRENEYLKTRQRLIILHMDAIQSQTERLKQLQQTLDLQMKEILQLRQRGLTGQSLKNYLEGLKEAYQSITVGTYCGDWRLDAIFHYYAGVLRENGVVPDFNFHHWVGESEDELPGKIFLMLLDMAAEESKREEARGQSCILQAGMVANQYVICMAFPWSKKEKRALRALKKLLDRQESALIVSVQGSRIKIKILWASPEQEKT